MIAKRILNSIDNNHISEIPGIYPNPAIEYFKIEMYNGHNYNKVRMINLYGENILQYDIEGIGLIEINRKNLPGGIYFLVFSDQTGNTKTEKIVFE